MARHGEKEAAICEAVSRLLARGEPPHTVTVQQIAREAGIGKGTIYEYFTSREEILTKTFIRRVEQETRALAARVDAARGFDAKIDEVLDFAGEAMRAHLSCTKLLLTDTRASGLVKTLCGSMDEGCALMAKQLRAALDSIVEAGIREGALERPSSESYALLAVGGGVLGYVSAQRLMPEESDQSLREQAKRVIYQALR